MKQKLISALGSFGMILYFVISALIYVFPIAMIGKAFWLNLIFFLIMYLFPLSSVVFWIWALVCTVGGPQDIFAILFYIAFALMFLPFFVNAVSGLFKK